jgi:hypothetical protein
MGILLRLRSNSTLPTLVVLPVLNRRMESRQAHQQTRMGFVSVRIAGGPCHLFDAETNMRLGGA